MEPMIIMQKFRVKVICDKMIYEPYLLKIQIKVKLSGDKHSLLISNANNFDFNEFDFL